MSDAVRNISRGSGVPAFLKAPRVERSWTWMCGALWRADSADRCHVNLLDTVLCERGGLTGWYFTSRDGAVLRKQPKNVAMDRIKDDFMRIALSYDTNTSGATFVVTRAGPGGAQAVLTAAGFNDMFARGAIPPDVEAIQPYVCPRGCGSESADGGGEGGGGGGPSFSNFQVSYAVATDGKAIVNCFKVGAVAGFRQATAQAATTQTLERSSVRSMDGAVNEVLVRSARRAVRYVEGVRKCRLVKAMLEFVVDSAGEAWLVRTTNISATNGKGKGGGGGFGGGMLPTVPVGDGPDHLAGRLGSEMEGHTYGGHGFKEGKYGYRRDSNAGHVRGRKKDSSSEGEGPGVLLKNLVKHASGGAGMKRGSRRSTGASSAASREEEERREFVTNLGSSQVEGCQGDYCEEAPTGAGVKERAEGESEAIAAAREMLSEAEMADLLNSLKNKPKLGPGASSAVSGAGAGRGGKGGGKKGKAGKQQHGEGGGKEGEEEAMVEITYKQIVQARGEKPLVDIMLNRHRNGKKGDYLSAAYHSALAEEVGKEYPGRYAGGGCTRVVKTGESCTCVCVCVLFVVY